MSCDESQILCALDIGKVHVPDGSYREDSGCAAAIREGGSRSLKVDVGVWSSRHNQPKNQP